MEKEKRRSPLAEAELEVEQEAREWGRERLRKRLQKMADKEGEFSPLKRSEIEAHTKAFDPFKDGSGQDHD